VIRKLLIGGLVSASIVLPAGAAHASPLSLGAGIKHHLFIKTPSISLGQREHIVEVVANRTTTAVTVKVSITVAGPCGSSTPLAAKMVVSPGGKAKWSTFVTPACTGKWKVAARLSDSVGRSADKGIFFVT
jgi:hypothetical protein